MKIAMVGLGGGLGAICRYLLGLYISNTKLQKGTSFPLAMLVVNLLGSFGLGYLMGCYYQIGKENLNGYLYLLVGIGFFGAFTTYSTFSLEVNQLRKARKSVTTLLYILFTLVGCISMFAFAFLIPN